MIYLGSPLPTGSGGNYKRSNGQAGEGNPWWLARFAHLPERSAFTNSGSVFPLRFTTGYQLPSLRLGRRCG